MKRGEEKSGKGFLTKLLLGSGVLLLEIVCGSLRQTAAEVVQEGEAQINFGGEEKIYTVLFDKDGNMEITAEYYLNPNSTLSYHTQKLLIANEETGGCPRTAKKQVEIDVGAHRIFTTGSASYDTYVIPERYLLEVGRTFFTAEALLLKDQTIYLNDIFILKRRSGAGETWSYDQSRYYSSLEEIRAAAAWSRPTYEGFAYYYDVPIRLRLMTLEYDVVCAEEATGRSLKVLEEGCLLPKGQNLNYEITEKKITVNGETYTYTGRYSYGAKSGRADAKVCIEQVTEAGTLQLYFKKEGAKQTLPETGNAGDSSQVEFFNPAPFAVIGAGERGAEAYDVTAGLPSGEEVYIAASAREYLLALETERVSGIKTWEVPYTLCYTLQWETEGVAYEETGSTAGTVLISRPYAYTKLTRAECYRLREAGIRNAALPDGEQTIEACGMDIPQLEFWHKEEEEAHVFPPEAVRNGIVLEKIVQGEGECPAPPGVTREEIDALVGGCIVKNDSLSLNGRVLLEEKEEEERTAEADFSVLTEAKESGEDALYRSGILVPVGQKNGSYSSGGYVKYERTGPSLAPAHEAVLYFQVEEVNPVVIHTPAYCKAFFSSEGSSFCELEEPKENKIQLVLDESGVTSSFYTGISNYGFHSSKYGYGNRDFASFLARKSGKLQNEVCFPFDVFVDIGNDKNTKNDILLAAGTWYVLGKETVRMYLPLWVKEGCYTVEYRSVAGNGASYLLWTEEERNMSREHYVATDRVSVQISGRLYDFTVYQVTGSDAWREVFTENGTFRLKRNQSAYTDGTVSEAYQERAWYDYKAGKKNAIGTLTARLEKYTLPLFCGSHPKLREYGLLKGGYRLYYRVSSLGSYAGDDAWLEVCPVFYQVLPETRERKEVDLYYVKKEAGKKQLVKAGGAVDLESRVSVTVGNRELAIPGGELARTATWFGEEEAELLKKQAGLFGPAGGILDAGLRMLGNSVYQQNWYGYYELPEQFFAVTKGYDVEEYYRENGLTFLEPFFLKEGYLVVQFVLRLHNASGEVLNYNGPLKAGVGSGYRSMWSTEGYIREKTDGKGRRFFLQEGDVAFYDMERATEFQINGIY